MNPRSWLKEPLVHFLFGGALLFAFFAWKGTPADPASREITVDEQALAGIALGFEQQLARAPTDSELDNLVERYVREEVLYREALRLGLDQDDAVVRRRLAQKMDLIAGAQAEVATPSEDVLQAWLDSNPQRFSEDTRYSFDQLSFETDKASQRGLKALQGGQNWRDLRASIDLPTSLKSAPQADLHSRFGQQFVRELEQLEAGENWQGPIPSGLGWHLIRLREVQNGEVPPLAEIREQVENDWRLATAKSREEDAYTLLRDAYTIEIER